MNCRSFAALALFVLVRGVSAQQPPPAWLLDWVDTKGSASFSDQILKRLDGLTDFFVRVTSPDIPRESKHLWIVSADGKNKCLVSQESAVSDPRWGAGGFILYLVEADTNGDGVIDYKDEYLVRAIQPNGQAARTLGQGQSAVWSPDGRRAAIIHDSKILVAGLDGQTSPIGSGLPPGRIVVASSRASSRNRQFWAVEAQTGKSESLPESLRSKYMWLGSLSPSGRQLVFADAMKTAIFIRPADNSQPDLNLTNDRFSDMDPSWSPDERNIVYVSDSPLRAPLCRDRAW